MFLFGQQLSLMPHRLEEYTSLIQRNTVPCQLASYQPQIIS